MIELLATHWYLIFLFFVIAALYSSVGFGGGSSYLAVLAFSGILFTQIRSTALLCNIVVVISNVLVFIKEKQYDWKQVVPLVFASVPLAFLGGFIHISKEFFFISLGIILLFAAVTMWRSQKVSKKNRIKENLLSKNIAIGGIIGFISGMVGIGGGIFLSPYLHVTYWGSPKKIAAVSSFFILVNSVSGLSGQFFNSNFEIEWDITIILIVTVFFGSIVGNKLRKQLLSPIILKKATAILVAFVSLRILYNYFF